SCCARPYCALRRNDLCAKPQFSGNRMADADRKPAAPSLEEVRARLDAIDADLLALIDERSGLARQVAAAKAAAGDGGKFALRPGRVAQLLRRLLDKPRQAAPAGLVVRI